MALLTPQQLAAVGIEPTYVAATSGGDTVRPTAGLVLLVKNADASAKTVTLVRPGSEYGQANPDVATAVPAGKTYLIEVPPEFAGSDGLIDITYSAVTSVTVALVRT